MKRADFTLAASSDDEEIRALLGAVPMQGKWRVGFGREPSFFACPSPAGITEHTLVARRDGRLLSVGSWSERDAWVCGEVKRVGYLHGLRMDPGTAASMRVLREGYAALAERVSGSAAVAWFTSIDAANARARRVLESRASGLPRYTPLGHYCTRLVPVWGRSHTEHDDVAMSRAELTEFLNHMASRHDLSLWWDDARWEALASSGFTLRQMCVVRRRGQIVAAAGVWDQSTWKQVILHGCPPWWLGLRPVLRVAGAVFGWPRPPAKGERLAMGHVFPFAVEHGEEDSLHELWSRLASIARPLGVGWLALGLDEADPLWQTSAMRRRGVDYHTILYQVSGAGFPDEPLVLGDRLLRPECATL